MIFPVLLIQVLVVLLFGAYYFIKKKYNYWKERGVPFIEPEFIYGNIKQAQKTLSFGEDVQLVYNQLKKQGHKHGGVYMYLTPFYLPIDPEILKNIMVKDFDHFINRGMYVNEDLDPLTGHLFNLEDSKWKNLRNKMTPTFTSGKMKMMFQTLIDCTVSLDDILAEHAKLKDAFEIKDLLARFTTDIIGSCAFGLECNTLKNPNSEFRTYGQKTFEPDTIGRIKTMIGFIVPKNILYKLNFKVTDSAVEKFFIDIVRNTVEYRERNKVTRKDFLQLLLELRNTEKVSDDKNDVKNDNKRVANLTINEIAAQCFVFFLAGFETSSTTMTFALFEIAQNSFVQERLRKEIKEVLKKHDDQITYEAINEMEYLDRVIKETLRKYPPVSGLPRMCTKTYRVPGTDVVLEPGTRVTVPVFSIQRDPEYYPDPLVFDPERFTEENKEKRSPYTFLPFGEGPRNCIGLRFGLMQSKVGLVAILRNYKITLNEKTKLPMKLDPKAFVTSVEGGVWLNVCTLNDE